MLRNVLLLINSREIFTFTCFQTGVQTLCSRKLSFLHETGFLRFTFFTSFFDGRLFNKIQYLLFFFSDQCFRSERLTASKRNPGKFGDIHINKLTSRNLI